MRRLILLLPLLAWLPGIASAGYGYQGDLVDAAKRLDRSASYLYKSAYDQFGYSRITDDAKSFSRAASRFCELVVYGASHRELNRGYERLLRRFDRLNYKLGHRQHGYLDRRLYKTGKALNRVSRVLSKQRYAHRNYKDQHYYGQRNRYRTRSRSWGQLRWES
ncbi:MAG: hypothetical protein AAF438_05205 [Pseudomonadota bacterium]